MSYDTDADYLYTQEDIDKLEAELAEARAQIKEQAKDAYFTQQRLTEERDEARAQIAASEQEHQDFRLQNDAEWRAKLDHLKAQIAAKDVALTRIVNECSRFPIKDGLAFRVESIALNGLNSPATPAREAD
jgi:septal ring factor EnvC (AmiA/AmiB activator)